MTGFSRRRFLVVGCGALAAHQLGCGGHDTAVLPATISAGPASAVAAGSLSAVPGAPAAIGRDAGGIYAISLVCTHEACDISQGGVVSTSLIACPCHGSQFSGMGALLVGPATRPLPHLAVTADASGQLTIHGDQVVAADVRLQV